MRRNKSIDFAQPLPLLPLSKCVLLPHATIPLKIQEPRYRLMVRDALNACRSIAVALTVHASDDNPGLAAVRPSVCIGYIAKHARDESGGWLLLMQGVRRATIVGEVLHEPYRKALLDPICAPPVIKDDLAGLRDQIELLLADPILKGLASVSAIHNWLNVEIPTGVLIDLAITTLCPEAEQRYRMLAERDLTRRAEWLVTLLRETRHTLQVAERFRPPQLTDCLQVN